ncbi:MAG: V-type ATP synthase subunit I [Tissierellia bacterium]|nr:V-type ATP synthase subunit I [Tissierellia bacterium]
MTIVNMNKVNIIGLDSIKTELIKRIMDLGVIEVSSQDPKLTDPEWISYVKKDGNEDEVFSLDVKISQVNEVLNSLEKYDTSKRPLFITRKPITSDEFKKALDKNDGVSESVAKVLELNKSLSELCSEENKIEAAILSLKPWVKYDIPLNMTETKYTNIIMGTIPGIADIDELKSELFKTSDRCFLDVIDSDKDQYYCSFICLSDEKEDILELFKQYGFSPVTFKELSGTAAENIMQYENSLKDISAKRDTVENSIRELVTFKEEIQLYHDHLTIERDKNKILSNILKTDTTFYIEGWVPEVCKEKVQEVLEEYQCWYDFKEPEEDEDFPILLKNNSFSEPFDSITELYSLPATSNIDPTAVMAPFYVLFFGMMLGDVGYGLMFSLGCYIILKKFDIEGTFGKMLKVFFWGGLSTIFWGIMYGSWFGDGLVVGARHLFNINLPLTYVWVDPLKEPMTVLLVSFVMGLVHLFVGMGMSAYMSIRDGHLNDALMDVGLWYLFIIGPILWIAGDMIIAGSPLPVIGKWVTIASAIGLVLTQGRAKPNIVGKLTSGVLSLYGITGYLGDVLSYSRLLALGLATGVISSVLSLIGSMGSGIAGKIMFVLVFTFGHILNFAINGLGSFVHSARLQYVEFFGKFYEGGGDPFAPFTKKTKYIKFKEEI